MSVHASNILPHDSSVPNHAWAFSHIAYRPDIDGLRAVAVLAVMAFHLQFRFALGGFTGVDVFFVISGFLITSILQADMQAGRFSLRRFYVRRIRRILPALIAVLTATSAFTLLVCMPSELRDYARSLIGASLSASNLYFGFHSSYFDPLSLSRPALQTWSLGVEEQFYLLFPLLLLLVHRAFPGRVTLALGVMAALSFAASVYGAFESPTLAFFMPWTRACELLLGSLVATGAFPPLRSYRARNATATCGLLVIVINFLLMNGAVPFPGFAALLPCGGAALIIWSGQPVGSPVHPDPMRPIPMRPTLVARCLSTRPVVFLGLISYSLYLWHWPVIVFQNVGLWGEELPHRMVKLILLAISFTLAILSWRWIERPFRDGNLRLSPRSAFMFAGVSAGVLVLCATAALLFHGFPGRFPAAAVAVGDYVDEKANNRMGSCMVIRARDFQPDPCLKEDATRPNWLLIGDSHAAAQWAGLQQAFPAVHFLQVSRASCRPDPVRTDGDCGVLMQMIFHHYLLTHHVDRMVAVGRWVGADLPALDRLAAWTHAHNLPLTIIGPTQDYDAALPRLLAYGLLRHQADLADRHREPDTAPLDTTLAGLAQTRWHVPYISLVRMFCPAGHCAAYVDGQGTAPLLLDGDHFTNEGSLLAARRIAAEHLLPVLPAGE